MPISDHYVVQFLLQHTTNSNGPLQWFKSEEQGFLTHWNGVRIAFDNILTRTSSRHCITLSCDTNQCAGHRVQIVEPLKSGIFHPHYEREGDEQLAQLLSRLSDAILRQAYERARSAIHNETRIRETLYRRLIGATSAKSEL